jgi:hypothetical protein
MSISEDVAFYDLMESKRKASLTSQNLIDLFAELEDFKVVDVAEIEHYYRYRLPETTSENYKKILVRLAQEYVHVKLGLITEKAIEIDKIDKFGYSIAVEFNPLFWVPEDSNDVIRVQIEYKEIYIKQLKRNLKSAGYLIPNLDFQPLQSPMKDQLNPSCWDALQSFRDLNVNAPLVDCLLDLRKQIAEKDKPVNNFYKQDAIEDELDHTITIDGVVYYSAEHHKPVSGEMVIGFTKPFTSYEANDDRRNNGLPSFLRPMPEITWYSSDKSCWLVPCGSSYREENIKAWTKLPHPERTEELFDFMDRI